MFYALLVLQAQVPRAHELFHVAAVAIAASIVLSSSTDVLIAHWFRHRSAPERPIPESPR